MPRIMKIRERIKDVSNKLFPKHQVYTKKKNPVSRAYFFEWLPRRDSNPNKQNQNLRCYHYTTRQSRSPFRMAGSTGLEPATPGSTVQCANQLRHNPVVPKVTIVYHKLRELRKGVF